MTEERMEAMQQVAHWIEKPFALNTAAAKVRLVLNQQENTSG